MLAYDYHQLREESCSRCTAGFPWRNIWEKLSGKSMHALTPIMNAPCFHGVFSGRKSCRIIARVSYASFLKSSSLNALLSTMKQTFERLLRLCSETINTYFSLLKKARKIPCVRAKFDSCWLCAKLITELVRNGLNINPKFIKISTFYFYL